MPVVTLVHVVEPSAIRGAWSEEAGCVAGDRRHAGDGVRAQEWEPRRIRAQG